jgi:GDPmannose 4,6-dehydratase
VNVDSTVVAVNPKYYRPTEVDLLIGDVTKAKETFGWEAKTKFDELSRMMARDDYIKVLKRGF